MKKRLLLILCACVILDWYIKNNGSPQKNSGNKTTTSQESNTEKA